MSIELALMKAVLTALRDSTAISGPVLNRVYDSVPVGAERPYVHLRGVQVLDDGADQVDGQEAFIDLDVWSGTPGRVEVTTLASAVRKALHGAVLTLDDPYVALEIEHRETNIGDGGAENLSRARLSFHALLESA